MKAKEIREEFFKYFEGVGHKIVPSAPIVNKNDPTLLFTNAGMNQFKDYFLGNKKPEVLRVADTQKCLRVSGKHNDLEEVGIDSYHHTMFEMLGNWSFGDYFKKEAIEWAWELLTKNYQLAPDRLYVSVFKGDEKDGLDPDDEAAEIWGRILPKERILYFDRKDNFWEMGDTGPCGPCSEIHIDLRSDSDRKLIEGKELVNADHPLVVEIWNLVFIQFNRKADGSLEELPDKHVDTGMGFERLCMAVQSTKSNYDTDVFLPFIAWLEKETSQKYEGSYDKNAKKDIAFRVLVDHIRAVCFTIADGQMPSNTGAGYVIRRILRRAVRYYYSFLDRKEPLLHLMVPLLADSFKDVFPELKAQESFVSKIILEEEKGFLRTLEGGLKRISSLTIDNQILDGRVAFDLYDTYGFPIDLTRLIGEELGWSVNEDGFKKALNEQKNRSRSDAKKISGDWIEVQDVDRIEFIGYDFNQYDEAQVVKYRTIRAKDKDQYQIVLDKTPFYAESGGQVGDIGTLTFGEETIQVYDTKKENDLIIHYVNAFPKNIDLSATATINKQYRAAIQNNHSATHLLHSALREVLGHHVQQRGSLVNDKQLRFDFSHFEKMTEDQIATVESIVNSKIRENIAKSEDRNVPIAAAKELGAMMLFGEKYGDHVRVITFDPSYSVELCGGCHVEGTGEIGLFKIKSESAIAAGVRRIEAVTGVGALEYVDDLIAELNSIRGLFKNAVQTPKQVSDLIDQNKSLEKELQGLKTEKVANLKSGLIEKVEKIGRYSVLAVGLDDIDLNDSKTLGHNMEGSIENGIICFAIKNNDKVNLQIIINKEIAVGELNAGTIIRKVAKYIDGGGGGQAFYATAGGQNIEGINEALIAFKDIVRSL